jgi:segregation and condensation protein B
MSSEETKEIEIKEEQNSESEENTLENPEQALEAVLFAAGYPMTYDKLAEVFEISPLEVKAILYTMKNKYDQAEDRGIQLVFYDDSCQLCTKEGFDKYIRAALGIRQSGKLSNSCMETLAIIAYNQPVTKAVIEQIRGVDCTYAISALTDKNLITVSGRLDVPGKPNLYSTTDDFLRVFGLVGLSELPKPSEEAAVESEPEQITIEGI